MKFRGKEISLATQVFIAMFVGTIFGLVFGDTMTQFGFIGEIWLNCIKMVIIPMILTTLVVGIVSQKDLKSLGRISFRIMSYYTITTVLAAIVGIMGAKIIQPGKWAKFSGLASKEVAGGLKITASDFFLSLFSKNMFATFTEGNIIQTLIIAIMIGISILLIKDKVKREKLISGFETLEYMINSLIGIIMNVSPIGIFFLMADSFGKYGTDIFGGMAALLITFYFSCLVQIILVYGGSLFIFGGISPFKFIKDSARLVTYTVSTCSSVAAIPVNMKVAKEKFNVPEKISGFTIPLGSQMNSDGSVILYACVILFITQMSGQTLDIGTLLRMIILSTVLSLGGSGIPGSNIVKVLVLVQAFGLPTEIVGIVAAFYRLFDMGTTTNNCLGDLAGTVLVSKLEEKKERKEKKLKTI